ncbi:outer membrane protein assembly factor BamA [Thiomicrorhabdus sp. ZW0627]|uniref:outer membrane protein assembly factor BamA n=1 Tax=Thiomicrorhabdus sp. ZW0627 TaxID=3039774 RepID=UPI00243675BE|nr:outer membrane protein assembly factor BamA [Thiomicrorhabdus sp. ZW0627]MDG6772997.1 outer membrane protein assembly factor BamA [Thiomicrorhabdus sp. ZW0627]
MVNMKNMRSKYGVMSGLVLGLMLNASASYAFTVDKIEVEGSQRIGFETINSYLPITIGQDIDEKLVQQSIQQLYKTGFFKDVSLYQREPGILVVKVIERPSVAEIKIDGNSLIETDDFMEALNSLGIKKGRIYNQVELDRVVVDLKRRYQNQGYYAAEVKFITEQLPRNRVSLKIEVEEGEPATIGAINLVGNETYSDDRLKSLLLLSESPVFGSADKYSKPKLQADIETLKSYYMDRGFAEFNIRSSQVSLSTDKTKVFITINMTEGVQYTVDDISYTGDTRISQEELGKLQKTKVGDLFSRSDVISTMNAIRDRLSEEGYAYAEVKPDTELNKEAKTVSLKFDITPKDRVYVRRIEVEGNTRTRDYVIRREMRQLESAPYSLAQVRRSTTRLNRLGYFTKVDIDTKRVSADQVDLVVKVEEQSTGSFTAGVGYSQIDGVSFNVGVSERNFIGSGNQLDFKVSTSAARKSADIGMTNPYFTPDGVSFGGGFYLSEIDAEQLGVSDYTTNNYGIRFTVGYPLSEYSRINYGLKFDDQTLVCSDNFIVCKDYVAEKGDNSTSAVLSLSWSYDTKNSYYFPSKGQRFSLSGEVTAPISSDVSFYKLFMDEKWYYPLSENLTMKLKLGLAYGNGLGNYTSLPFYENFYAGGISSVRGYESNSLGAHYDLAADGSDRPIGGAAKVVSTVALVMPMPFIDDSSNMRLSLFYDAGNVFTDINAIEVAELRSSAGVGLSWITPVGPLSFSIANPISYTKDDKLQAFQFNLGIPL